MPRPFAFSLALLIGGVMTLPAAGQATRPRMPESDIAGLRPFTEIHTYMEQQTGLYPGGKNEIPADHLKAGQRIATTVRPLNADGKPDDTNGKIVALVMGHSNCAQYFTAFQQQLRQKSDELHPRFEMINAAVGGNQLPEIRQLKGAVWDKAAKLLSQPGYGPAQVQVLFLHTTYHGAGNRGNVPARPFPQTMRQMQADLAVVLQHAQKTWPNLKVAYLTCDGLRRFTGFEPHVFQEAFGFKWMIESQIKGEPGTAFEDQPNRPRQMPWLQWGPYIWDPAWDRTFFTDGVHPGPNARAIFVEKYWTFLKGDPVAKSWMFKP